MRILRLAVAFVFLAALVLVLLFAIPKQKAKSLAILPAKKLQLQLMPVSGIPVSQQLLLRVQNVGEYDFRFLPRLQAAESKYPGVFIELVLTRKDANSSPIRASKAVLERIDQPVPDSYSFKTLRPNEYWQQPLSSTIWGYREYLEQGQEITIKARVVFGQCEWLENTESQLGAPETRNEESRGTDCPEIESAPTLFLP